MLAIVSVVIIFATVFGSYILSGGSFEIILYALPYEMGIIGGAAIGAFLLSNSMSLVKKTVKDVKSVVKGSAYGKQDYTDLLCLMFEILRVYKSKGALGLESHTEAPEESPIFSRYPKILKDHFIKDLICDSLRVVTLEIEDPHAMEEIIEKKIKRHHAEATLPSKALQTMADGLPAIGIVAAVLGVIKTMGAIDQPPPVLGKMIGGALTGTFLGVFLAYCFVGPAAARMKLALDEDSAYALVVKDVLVAVLSGYSPQVSVELGRSHIPTDFKPDFYELEQAVQDLPAQPK